MGETIRTVRCDRCPVLGRREWWAELLDGDSDDVVDTVHILGCGWRDIAFDEAVEYFDAGSGGDYDSMTVRLTRRDGSVAKATFVAESVKSWTQCSEVEPGESSSPGGD